MNHNSVNTWAGTELSRKKVSTTLTRLYLVTSEVRSWGPCVRCTCVFMQISGPHARPIRPDSLECGPGLCIFKSGQVTLVLTNICECLLWNSSSQLPRDFFKTIKKKMMSYPFWDSELIGLGCGLGIWIFKSSPGDWNMQPRLTTHAPRLGLAIFFFYKWPDSKYFSLCRPSGLCRTSSTVLS